MSKYEDYSYWKEDLKKNPETVKGIDIFWTGNQDDAKGYVFKNKDFIKVINRGEEFGVFKSSLDEDRENDFNKKDYKEWKKRDRVPKVTAKGYEIFVDAQGVDGDYLNVFYVFKNGILVDVLDEFDKKEIALYESKVEMFYTYKNKNTGEVVLTGELHNDTIEYWDKETNKYHEMGVEEFLKQFEKYGKEIESFNEESNARMLKRKYAKIRSAKIPPKQIVKYSHYYDKKNKQWVSVIQIRKQENAVLYVKNGLAQQEAYDKFFDKFEPAKTYDEERLLDLYDEVSNDTYVRRWFKSKDTQFYKDIKDYKLRVKKVLASRNRSKYRDLVDEGERLLNYKFMN